MTIQELLADRGLTIDALAEKIGVDASSLSACVQGEAKPTVEVLAAIKKAYGVDVDIPAPASQDANMTKEPADQVEEAESPETQAVEATAAEQTAKVAEAEEAVETAAEEQTAKVAAAQEAVETAAEEQTAEVAEAEEAVEAAAEEQTAKVAPTEQAVENAAEEQAAEIAALQQTIETAAVERAAEIAALEAAAEEEAARKTAKKAAKKAAKKQKADEEAAQWVAVAIQALGDSVDMDDEDAVAAAREAYDSLTYDQEQLIPGDLLNMLLAAEQMIEDAAKTFPIEDCWITVKDVPFTGKKIKRPSVKAECGDKKLKEGEDYTFSYDKKIRDIGLYTLKIKGQGHFTGSVEVPFYVLPKAKTFIKMMSDDKEAAHYWKCLKQVKGFQVEYSLNEDFSGSKKEKIKKYKDVKKLLKALKAGKEYYVRVRIYATIHDEKYYSAWSKVMILET